MVGARGGDDASMPLPAAGCVLGVDVGYSPVRRSSAVCRFDWTRREVGWSIARFRFAAPEREETIARIAGGRPLLAAAFDGPLRRGLDVMNAYRPAERMLTVGLGRLVGKPGQSNTPGGRALNAAANRLAGIVLDVASVAPAGTAHDGAVHDRAIHERAILETFPHAFLGLMLAEPARLAAVRADRSDVFYMEAARTGALARLVAALLPGRTVADFAAVTDHDERAALVCALAALAAAAGEGAAVGDPVLGWIGLPPWSAIQPWGQALLRANAAAGCGLLAGAPLVATIAADALRER